TPSRCACARPSDTQYASRASPSWPAAVGICTYRGGRPSISPPSTSSIAGVYSPDPTSAIGPATRTAYGAGPIDLGSLCHAGAPGELRRVAEPAGRRYHRGGGGDERTGRCRQRWDGGERRRRRTGDAVRVGDDHGGAEERGALAEVVRGGG